jgi:hypothetical protein
MKKTFYKRRFEEHCFSIGSVLHVMTALRCRLDAGAWLIAVFGYCFRLKRSSRINGIYEADWILHKTNTLMWPDITTYRRLARPLAKEGNRRLLKDTTRHDTTRHDTRNLLIYFLFAFEVLQRWFCIELSSWMWNHAVF